MNISTVTGTRVRIEPEGGQMSNDDVKAAARRVLEEIFPADDEMALVAATSADFVNHEAPPGTPPGPGSVIYYMHLLAKAFSDQRWTIHRVIAEGDTAVMYCTHSGRHTGDYFGIKPSGRRFAYTQMHIVRVRDGQGVEHWAVRDDTTLMRQLTGELAAPEAS
jgi:predicted SnoaL-like aldol condensation-catalyzing enzyme